MTLLTNLATTPNRLIPAAGDGETFSLLSQSAFPAILLDGTLSAKTLLAQDNQGLLTESEYAKFLRDMQLRKHGQLIADLQSGFGSPLNTYYAAQDLERSGADILLLNDQKYPSHSTNHPATTSAEDLLGKARAAQDALENPATELWIKLEGIKEYGVQEAQNRITYLANAGADAIIISHYQSEQLQALLDGHSKLPLLATWTPDTQPITGLAGWLDTGYLAQQAQTARQDALNKLLEGAIQYAEK
ncbi:isocitrate lyase/phosphoenolpyruvate mutase family protein [Secundilactobacillus folii]|uniref:isocitrate lyase/phosphoenolpyruvate mutase family protein n=1 Tax=Secundilactobacillus folii TaxID=2678357 RepID=UPI0012D3FD53|nr:isocitrate lyase/phosphoenolpyruvate mutase family protein [Secundilactobacillus folii]